jgi:hypothetical protein
MGHPYFSAASDVAWQVVLEAGEEVGGDGGGLRGAGG